MALERLKETAQQSGRARFGGNHLHAQRDMRHCLEGRACGRGFLCNGDRLPSSHCLARFRPVCLNSSSSGKEQGWGAAGKGRVGERQPAVSLQGQACVRLFLNLRDLSLLCRGKKGRREGCCSSLLSCEALWSELCVGQEGWVLASPGGCGLRQAPTFLGPLTWSDREL